MRVLYKYVAPARLDVLRDRRIRFTQSKLFNDPFEARPYFKSLLEPEIIGEVCDFGDDAEANIQFREKATAIMESPETRRWAQDSKAKNLVVLSLAERPDNLLMWAHYAKDHEGLVLGVDIEHPSLAIRKDGIPRYLVKVAYARERPARTALIHLSIDEFFATKSDDWQYEQEWRMFDGAVYADATAANDEQVLLFNLSPEAVRQVILGCRAEKATADPAREVLRQQDYSHVELLQAVLDEKEYRLNLLRV